MTLPIVTSFVTAPSSREIDSVARIIQAVQNETVTVRQLSRFWKGRYDPRAIRQALQLADHDRSRHRGTVHSPRLRGTGTAARAIQRQELYYRAAYLANATRRINAKLDAGLVLRDATAAERTYYASHELARRNRQNAAKAVDAMADIHGETLGWWAHEDDRTTPECRAADGSNFIVGQMPRIGYPGMPHGGTCRCKPGPRHPADSWVDNRTLGITHS